MTVADRAQDHDQAGRARSRLLFGGAVAAIAALTMAFIWGSPGLSASVLVAVVVLTALLVWKTRRFYRKLTRRSGE